MCYLRRMAKKLERWLFVCTGNICRSPYAEVVARSLSSLPNVEFASAGTIAIPGNPATKPGRSAAEEAGFDLTAHRATALTADVVGAADRIFGMERHHVDAVLAFDPSAPVETLDIDGNGIFDPYGGSADDYDASYRLIERAVRERLDGEARRREHAPGNPLC